MSELTHLHGEPAGHGDHGNAQSGHADGHGHGLGHVSKLSTLIIVWAALMLLTVITVAVTKIDLGASNNLLVALVVATIKAILVCLFFMHMIHDKATNVVIFFSSVLFLAIFILFTYVDTREYKPTLKPYTVEDFGKRTP